MTTDNPARVSDFGHFEQEQPAKIEVGLTRKELIESEVSDITTCAERIKAALLNHDEDSVYIYERIAEINMLLPDTNTLSQNVKLSVATTVLANCLSIAGFIESIAMAEAVDTINEQYGDES